MGVRERAEALKEKTTALVPTRHTGAVSIYLDSAKFDQTYRAAKLLADAGEMVPAHFRGSWQKCFVALELSDRFDMSPIMVMQRTYIVHGRPGLEAQLKIALANQRAPLSGGIQWDIERDAKGIVSCTAWATRSDTGERVEMTLDRGTVAAEGWESKQGSKWKTMPEKMYRYRSASWLIDLYFPDVSMGLPSTDELADIQDAPIDVEFTEQAPEPEPEPAPEKPKKERAKKQIVIVDNTLRNKIDEALKWAEQWMSRDRAEKEVASSGINLDDPETITAEAVEQLSARLTLLADEG